MSPSPIFFGLIIAKDNIWPLTVFSTWFVDFLEELMRECILLGDSREGLADDAIGGPLFGDGREST